MTNTQGLTTLFVVVFAAITWLVWCWKKGS
jgi:hypothetical protein